MSQLDYRDLLKTPEEITQEKIEFLNEEVDLTTKQVRINQWLGLQSTKEFLNLLEKQIEKSEFVLYNNVHCSEYSNEQIRLIVCEIQVLKKVTNLVKYARYNNESDVAS